MLPAVGEDEGTVLPWPAVLPQNADKRRFPRVGPERGAPQLGLREYRAALTVSVTGILHGIEPGSRQASQSG